MTRMTETVFDTNGRIKVSRTANEPVGQQLVRQLRTLITTGQVDGQTRLPSYTQLGQQLSVNRLTVAKAYQVLENEGLVKKRQGLGTFVSDEKRLGTARCTVSLCMTRSGEAGGLRHNDIVPQLFLEGVERHLSNKNINVNMLVVPHGQVSQETAKRLAERITQHEGAIFIGELFRPLVEQLLIDRFPCVLCRTIASGLQGVSFVNYDRRKAFRAMTEHLIAQGCTRIGFVGERDYPHDGMPSLKFAGYLDALEAHGLTYDPRLRIECAENALLVETHRRTLAQATQQGKIGDGLICGGHGMGVSATFVLPDHGIRIPDDVAIVSNDEMGGAEHTSPTLTDLRIPRFEMGQAAAETLTELMLDGDGEPLEKWVNAPLIVRQSSIRKP